MATERQEGMLPPPLAVVDQGIAFSREWLDDGVEIEMDERSITITREDWDAIVAHVALRDDAAEQPMDGLLAMNTSPTPVNWSS
jgi:hypothetical protein